jgi:hypothetical protein
MVLWAVSGGQFTNYRIPITLGTAGRILPWPPLRYKPDRQDFQQRFPLRDARNIGVDLTRVSVVVCLSLLRGLGLCRSSPTACAVGDIPPYSAADLGWGNFFDRFRALGSGSTFRALTRTPYEGQHTASRPSKRVLNLRRREFALPQAAQSTTIRTVPF